MTGSWVSKWGERENGTGLRKEKKTKEERGVMWLCRGFQNEGKKKRERGREEDWGLGFKKSKKKKGLKRKNIDRKSVV